LPNNDSTDGCSDAGVLSIMHLISPAAIGGMERVVQSLAGAQHRTGHEVRVVAVLDDADSAHPFFVPLDAAGVPHHTVIAPGKAYRRELLSVQRLCAELEPDLVHTHGRRSDVVGVVVSRRVGLPCVSTVHGAIGGSLRNRLYMRAQHRALRNAEAVVAVSRVIAEKLRRSGIHPERIRMIQNAWSPTEEPLSRGAARAALGLAPDAQVVGWVGRLSPEKGADVLIDAAASLRDLPLLCSLVGEGSERDSLRRQVERTGMQDRVHLHGVVPDAGRLFQAFDCFVLSSHTEGTPMVLFEAMATDTPIVATRVGGVADVVPESDGILIPAGDSDALADAIRFTLSDPESAATRASSAKRRLHELFSTEEWVSLYDEVYRDVAERSSVGAE